MAQPINKLMNKKEVAPVIRKPNDPEALFRSKKDQVAINRKKKEATAAAKKAFDAKMAEIDAPVENKELAAVERKLIQQKQLLKTLVKNEKELNVDLEEAEGSQKKPIRSKIEKSKKNMEDIKLSITDLENEIELLKESE